MLLFWTSCRRSVVKRVLHADDPPHRLALGVAVSIFITFTPTIGFQSALVIFLAVLLRANKVVGLPIVWISNPATFVPIYYSCYRIGLWFTGGNRASMQWWRELAQPPADYMEAMAFYWSRFAEIIAPLLTGCFIVAVPLAIVSYFVTYQVIVRHRHRRILRRHSSGKGNG